MVAGTGVALEGALGLSLEEVGKELVGNLLGKVAVYLVVPIIGPFSAGRWRHALVVLGLGLVKASEFYLGSHGDSYAEGFVEISKHSAD